MLYWLQVYLLIAIPIFVLGGTVLLTLMAWAMLKEYVRSRLAIRQIAGPRVPVRPVKAPLQEAS